MGASTVLRICWRFGAIEKFGSWHGPCRKLDFHAEVTHQCFKQRAQIEEIGLGMVIRLSIVVGLCTFARITFGLHAKTLNGIF